MKLLVIDIQKGITDSRLFNFDEFIDNTSRIIQAARDNQIEVIYFQHDDGPGTGFSIGDEEFEIAEQVHPREGEKIFTKNINSCFGNKDFTDYVKDENTLMIVDSIICSSDVWAVSNTTGTYASSKQFFIL